jgi:hypothetical protein
MTCPSYPYQLQIDYLQLILHAGNFDARGAKLQAICSKFEVRLVHQIFSANANLISDEGRFSCTPETYEICLFLEERPFQTTDLTFQRMHRYLVCKSDTQKLLKFHALWRALIPFWANLTRLDIKRKLFLVPELSYWWEELELAYRFAAEQQIYGRGNAWERLSQVSVSPSSFDADTQAYTIYLGTRTESSLYMRICSYRAFAEPTAAADLPLSHSYIELECKKLPRKFAHFLKIGNFAAFEQLTRQKFIRAISLLKPCLYTREIRQKALVLVDDHQFVRGVPLLTRTDQESDDLDSLLLLTLFEFLHEAEGSPLKSVLGMFRLEIGFISFCRLLLRLDPKVRVRKTQQDKVKRSLMSLFQANLLSYQKKAKQVDHVGVQRFISQLKFTTSQNKVNLIIWLCLDSFRSLIGSCPLPRNLLARVFQEFPAEKHHLKCFLVITIALCNNQEFAQVTWSSRVGHKKALKDLENFAYCLCNTFKDSGSILNFSLIKCSYKSLCVHLNKAQSSAFNLKGSAKANLN